MHNQLDHNALGHKAPGQQERENQQDRNKAIKNAEECNACCCPILYSIVTYYGHYGRATIGYGVKTVAASILAYTSDKIENREVSDTLNGIAVTTAVISSFIAFGNTIAYLKNKYCRTNVNEASVSQMEQGGEQRY